MGNLILLSNKSASEREQCMKLRNFLYLNTKIIADYMSAIDGYTYDEESQIIASSDEHSASGGVGLKVVSTNGIYSGKQSEEIKRSVTIGDAAKFDKIYKYLQSGDEDESLKFYETMSEEIYNKLSRDDFIEVLVTARFSKTKVFADSVQKIASLAVRIQEATNRQILDKNATETINGISALGKIKSEKEISCVFDFEDGKFPLVSYLDSNYFKCEQDSFVGQSYMLCKVIRKIPQGQSIKIDEIFDDIKKLPLNRKQKRSLPKNIDNPDIIRDVVKGPAIVVLPIAVYQ